MFKINPFNELWRNIHLKKAIKATKIRRAEEIAEELRTRIDVLSPFGYLASCYAKDGKVMSGKWEMKPELFRQALPKEVVRVYDTAVRNNTSMNMAKKILRNNQRFIDESHAEHYISWSRFRGFYLRDSGEISQGRFMGDLVTPEDIHWYRQLCEKEALKKQKCNTTLNPIK